MYGDYAPNAFKEAVRIHTKMKCKIRARARLVSAILRITLIKTSTRPNIKKSFGDRKPALGLLNEQLEVPCKASF